MQRRYALSGALALTTIVTFALIILGMEAGMFGAGGSAEEAPPAVTAEEDIAGALLYLAAQPTEPAPPAEYVAAEPRVTTEYVYLYETVPAPAQPQLQAAAAPTVAPTQPVPTPPLQDGATLEPWPTDPPPPTEAPVAPPPSADDEGAKEIEFRGTVTAIAGDLVTWSYGGGAVTTRVVEDLDELSIGTEAKVHAIHTSSGYVAKEIETDEDD